MKVNPYLSKIFIISVLIAILLTGCASIPIPSSIPIPNEIPIIGWLFH